MAVSSHDVQRLAHLMRLDKGLADLGLNSKLDLRRVGIALPSIRVRAKIRRGRWIYTWGPRPWCRVDAEDAGAVQRVHRAAWWL